MKPSPYSRLKHRIKYILWRFHNRMRCHCKYCVLWRGEHHVNLSEDIMENI